MKARSRKALSNRDLQTHGQVTWHPVLVDNAEKADLTLVGSPRSLEAGFAATADPPGWLNVAASTSHPAILTPDFTFTARSDDPWLEVVHGVVTISRGGIRTLHPRGLSVRIGALTGRQNNVADTTILDGAIYPGHCVSGRPCSGVRG